MARMYEVVWKRIKKDRRVVLAVKPYFVARVKKAVIKEKWLDIGFKLINDHDRFSLLITYDKDKEQLAFELKQAWGLEDMKEC